MIQLVGATVEERTDGEKVHHDYQFELRTAAPATQSSDTDGRIYQFRALSGAEMAQWIDGLRGVIAGAGSRHADRRLAKHGLVDQHMKAVAREPIAFADLHETTMTGQLRLEARASNHATSHPHDTVAPRSSSRADARAASTTSAELLDDYCADATEREKHLDAAAALIPAALGLAVKSKLSEHMKELSLLEDLKEQEAKEAR